jgi:RNA recognition motif. (a.k.a. RRM, RBD, or RNP domain)
MGEKAREEPMLDTTRGILGGDDSGHNEITSLSDPSGVLSWALGQPTPTQSLSNPTVSEAPRGKGEGNRAGRGGVANNRTIVRRTGGGIQIGEHTGFIRMRGLPFSSTKEDIVTFFQAEGLKVIPDTVVLTFRGDGRATGEGYVGFESVDDSKAAMGLHRNTMGSRYIELFISNKEEHSRAFTRFGGR